MKHFLDYSCFAGGKAVALPSLFSSFNFHPSTAATPTNSPTQHATNYIPKYSIEQKPPRKYLFLVRILKTVLLLTLALAWVPLTSHCKLEAIPGLNFLACLDQPKETSHQADDCQTDGCALLEKSLYKSETQPLKVSKPDVTNTTLLAVLLSEIVASVEAENALPPPAVPSELFTSWQFCSRAALPPRAPSIDS